MLSFLGSKEDPFHMGVGIEETFDDFDTYRSLLPGELWKFFEFILDKGNLYERTVRRKLQVTSLKLNFTNPLELFLTIGNCTHVSSFVWY